MERKKLLLKLFQDLGCKVENDVVLNRCSELCKSYNVDEEKFTEYWLTFCVNNDNDIDPTLDTLDQMENAVLKKDYKPHDLIAEYYENEKQNIADEHIVKNITVENDEMLSMYGCVETGLKRKTSSEEDTIADAQPSTSRAAEYSFSSANFVDNSSTTSHERNVTDKRKILFTFGPFIASWESTGDYNVEISNFDESLGSVKYMYEILEKQMHLYSNMYRNLGNVLCKAWSAANGKTVKLHQLRNAQTTSQMKYWTCGRISTKKESTNTVMLDSSCRSMGRTRLTGPIELDFRNVKHYSVFSGQIAMIEAINPVGDMLYVQDIFAKAYAPPASTPRLSSRINIFVATGPFTASNNMNYQPLLDLLEKVASDKPHVLILIGPFLEYTHPEIQENHMDTHQELFEKILAKIMGSARQSTQVVLVASNRDAHHEPIYPTRSYEIFNRQLLNYSNLKLMPDPSIFDIEGLNIGVTSVDVIKHIGQVEVSNISSMDRLSRLADHVLAQMCFYPVYPPSEHLNLDTELWENIAFFSKQPHLLILPSDMRCFCKIINGCMILNPERVHKRTYARLSVKPAVDGEWSADNISCEIAKI